MFAADGASFRYLNTGNSWPGFNQYGLEVTPDGVARLASLPRLESEPPAELATLIPLLAPAGIAALQDGTVFWTIPSKNLVMKRGGCTQVESPVPCLGSAGSQATQFREPRGVLFHRRRHALFIADSGNHRLQVFDP